MGIHELFPIGLVRGNVNGLVAVNGDALEVLGTQHTADTSADVALGIDEDGHREKIFSGRSDNGNRSRRRGFLLNELMRAFGPLTPDVGGVTNLNVVIINIEINRALGFSFNNEKS